MRAGVPGWSCSIGSWTVWARIGASPAGSLFRPIGLRQDGGVGEEGDAHAVLLLDHRSPRFGDVGAGADHIHAG